MKRLIFLLGLLSVSLSLSIAQKEPSTARTNQGPTHAGAVQSYEAIFSQPFLDSRMGSIQSRDQNGVLWSHVVRVPEATFLKVYFEDYRLLSGDSLEVLDTEGRVRQRIYGSGPGGRTSFWSLSIPGDTLILQIHSKTDYSKRFAFRLTKIFKGEIPLFGSPELSRSVCTGLSEAEPFRSAFCYSPNQDFDDPAIWQNAQAGVGVLTIGDYGTGSWCSGSLVSSQDYVLTNQHCIETLADCQNAEFVFNYYRDSCEEGIGGIDPITTQGYYCDPTDETTFIKNDFGDCTPQNENQLDYAFAHVLLNGDDPSPSTLFQPLDMELDYDTISSTEEVYIVGHPEGNARVVSKGVLDFTTPYGLHYICDTRGGSSGSPVYSLATHKLIGLHHCGGCTDASLRNRGMFISQVRADIDQHGDFFEPVASLIFSSISYSDATGDDDGFFDIGEVIDVTVTLRNSGQLASTAGTLTLESESSGIEIVNGSQTVPVLDAVTNRANEATLNLSFRIHDTIACGHKFPLRFTVTYGERSSTATAALQAGEMVATIGPFEALAADTPIDIPDNDDTGIASQVVIEAGTDPLHQVEEVEVNITHTYIGDLTVALTSPGGTTVALHSRSGGSADNLAMIYGNGLNGTTAPAGDFGSFTSEAMSGTWTLSVVDSAGQDIGSLDSWRLKISGAEFSCNSNAIPLTIGSVSSQNGATIDIPISLNEAVNDSFSFDIHYDPSSLLFLQASLTGLLPCASATVTNPSPGLIHVEADCSLRGTLHELLTLQFEIFGISEGTALTASNLSGGLSELIPGTGTVTLPPTHEIDFCTLTTQSLFFRWLDSDSYNAAIDTNSDGQINILDLVARSSCL